jgi:hypothetical protein
MKKILLTLTACLLLSASWVMGQSASLTFNDNGAGGGTATDGTYNPNDVFSVAVSLTFAGGNSPGYSFWLETETGVHLNISITSAVYSTFSPTDPGYPKTFTDTSGASAGFFTDVDTVINPNTGSIDSGDLGGTLPIQTPGTYPTVTLTFSLANAPLGTWHLYSTTTSPKITEATVAGTDAFIPQTIYTFIVVPEPATWSLMALGGLGTLGLTLLRARRKS